jgi:hypothetical protein
MRQARPAERQQRRRGGAMLVALALWTWLPAAQAQEWLYTVRPGDSLWLLSNRYLRDAGLLPELQRLNGIADPQGLRPGSLLRIPVNWLRTPPAPVEVLYVRGAVEVVHGAGGPAEPLQVGMALAAGDRVRTGPDSTATLRFADGSRLLLQAASELALDRVSADERRLMVDSSARLADGRIDVRTPGGSGFEVQTPATVTSVRGTRFRVGMAREEALQRTEVIEGLVAVEAQGRVQELQPGEGSLTPVGAPPQPAVALLPPPDISAIPTFLDRVPIAFSLPALPGAVAYRLQIAPDEQYDALLFDEVFPSPDFAGPAAPDGSYTWRVRGIDARGLEGLDASKNLTLDARPPAPPAVAPGEGEAVPRRRPRFDWQDAEGAASYRFQLAAEPTFAAPLVDRAGLAASEVTLEEDLAAGRYHWRVAGSDADGGGPWSEPQAVAVEGASPWRFAPLLLVPIVALVLLL